MWPTVSAPAAAPCCRVHRGLCSVGDISSAYNNRSAVAAGPARAADAAVAAIAAVTADSSPLAVIAISTAATRATILALAACAANSTFTTDGLQNNKRREGFDLDVD